MGRTYQQQGAVLDYTNGTGSDISADDVVAVGDCIGIALVDIADGETGAVAIDGMFQVTKVAGTAWTQGAKLDWDASAEAFDVDITAAAGDVEDCGIAALAAATADTVGYIRLTP